MKEILKSSKEAIVVFSLVLSAALLLCIVLLAFDAINLVDISNFSTILNNFITPILTCTAVILTFLAFYVQKEANDSLRKQISKQDESASQDFQLNGFKERINLIINDINNFNVSFHDGKLIENTISFNNKESKKYNFVNIQGISLFLLAYFNDFNNYKNNLDLPQGSFHATFVQIHNLVSFFDQIHFDLENSNLNEAYKKEIYSLLKYTYFSKIIHIVEGIMMNVNCPSDIKIKVKPLNDFYNKK